jgi:hypothetical protein
MVFNFIHRQEALVRLGKKCAICGGAEGLEIHHADKNRHNDELGNLLPLCKRCHESIHAMLDSRAQKNKSMLKPRTMRRRLVFYPSIDVGQRLSKYVQDRYHGTMGSLSWTVEEAIEKFLDAEAKKV